MGKRHAGIATPAGSVGVTRVALQGCEMAQREGLLAISPLDCDNARWKEASGSLASLMQFSPGVRVDDGRGGAV